MYASNLLLSLPTQLPYIKTTDFMALAKPWHILPAPNPPHPKRGQFLTYYCYSASICGRFYSAGRQFFKNIFCTPSENSAGSQWHALWFYSVGRMCFFNVFLYTQWKLCRKPMACIVVLLCRKKVFKNIFCTPSENSVGSQWHALFFTALPIPSSDAVCVCVCVWLELL